LLSKSVTLPPEAVALLAKADLFFISTAHSDLDMDTNHRGGPPGFIRILSNPTSTSDGAAEIIYPEYSGNRLYQTLGNLHLNPLAGLVIPDFSTGNVLYLTGSATILAGAAAAALLPHSNLAVKLLISEARFVTQGLPFRGTAGEPSPYNPNLRVLASESSISAPYSSTSSPNTATLIAKEVLTPTISRYRFALSNPNRDSSLAEQRRPGQWVALDFSRELSVGYSHMRDEDPRSLNDDYVRTFTVSSVPREVAAGLAEDEFEITVREVGPVTRWLGKSEGGRSGGVEIPVLGVGGEVRVETGRDGEEEVVGFVAGGVGITPLLGQLGTLELERLRVFWTVRGEDVGLVVDALEKNKDVARRTTVFFTGGKEALGKEGETILKQIEEMGAKVEMRRLMRDDLRAVDARRWYVCAGSPLQKLLVEWLKDKEVICESFKY